MIKKNLISIKDLSKEEILEVIKEADKIKKHPPGDILKGKIMASCFFEPSTRTRLSFECAMHKLGGSVIGFADSGVTSLKKGETLQDTMKMMGSYADIIVIRHPESGSAAIAAQSTETPIINAGDGANEHPTQTLLDLFTIQELHGKIDGLHIALIGDLKYGRVARSLAYALKHFKVHLYFIAPDELKMKEDICNELKGSFTSHKTIEEVIDKLDILYVTRVQQERFPDQKSYDAVKNSFILTKEQLKRAKQTLKVLHALPRVNEIPVEVDSTPFAAYFQQAENGIYVRQALLKMMVTK